MAAFKTFEEINAWQNARVLVKDVYAMTRLGYITEEKFKTMYKSAKQIGGMLFKLIDVLSSTTTRTK